MDFTRLTIRTTPDALVKLYDETEDTVVWVDNTDEKGETPPLTLDSAHQYDLEITPFNLKQTAETQTQQNDADDGYHQ